MSSLDKALFGFLPYDSQKAGVPFDTGGSQNQDLPPGNDDGGHNKLMLMVSNDISPSADHSSETPTTHHLQVLAHPLSASVAVQAIKVLEISNTHSKLAQLPPAWSSAALKTLRYAKKYSSVRCWSNLLPKSRCPKLAPDSDAPFQDDWTYIEKADVFEDNGGLVNASSGANDG